MTHAKPEHIELGTYRVINFGHACQQPAACCRLMPVMTRAWATCSFDAYRVTSRIRGPAANCQETLAPVQFSSVYSHAYAGGCFTFVREKARGFPPATIPRQHPAYQQQRPSLPLKIRCLLFMPAIDEILKQQKAKREKKEKKRKKQQEAADGDATTTGNGLRSKPTGSSSELTNATDGRADAKRPRLEEPSLSCQVSGLSGGAAAASSLTGLPPAVTAVAAQELPASSAESLARKQRKREKKERRRRQLEAQLSLLSGATAPAGADGVPSGGVEGRRRGRDRGGGGSAESHLAPRVLSNATVPHVWDRPLFLERSKMFAKPYVIYF
eukprot:jgi/Mesvir1/5102/Mv15264-RA.1